MRHYPDDLDVTDGIDTHIWKAIDKSMDNNSIETFRVLKSFVRRVIQISIHEKSQKHFEKYIFFPSHFYSVSYLKAKQNPELTEMHKFCSTQASMHQKEILLYDIGFERRKNKSLKEQIELNKFYYWGFYAYSRLLFFIVRNSDIQQFRLSMNEFDQVADNSYNKHYELKSEIKRLEIENPNAINNNTIKDKKEELKILKAFDDYRRHTIEGIKYWIIFLYRVNKIKEEIVTSFLERLIVNGSADDLLQDILFFRGNLTNFYMGWSEWDFMERPSGKSYSPPNPYDWMTFGFMVDQIRGNPLYVNVKELNSEDLSQTRFLYDALKVNADYFQKNFDKWKKLLNVETPEKLKEKCDSVLKVFEEVKKKRIRDSDSAIANAPLNLRFVNNFKEGIGKAWKNQARIHKLFKKIGSTELVTDSAIKLRIIGQRTFFEKAKMMFIDGEHNQTIMGVDRMGGETGRWEDDEFFSSIMKGDYNKITGINAVEVLEKSIVELQSKKINPTLILLSPEYSYRERLFLEDKRFISKMNEPQEENSLQFFYLGTFDNIPIYTSHSAFLKNRIVICDFNVAFKMRYKTNPDWFEQELTVRITEVTDEEAKQKLAENPAKWQNTDDGINLTNEEALVLIKTSIIMDIWATVDFQVLNKEAYVVGFVKSDISNE
ncbi:MAG: hypothetical protein A3F72_16140 [Bacteroidetes bacterium RIFCSPLOWO2_12_FULL_35_15]|nr:MAG: hypothetical protein A3F72_16140 [Bacteroidetes bacterium RIFCSPLOWO2_12_FULL_35_15]